MSIAEQDFDFVRAFICEQAGIVLEHGKQYLVEARLTPIAKKAGLPSLQALVERLRAGDAALRRAAVEALTTNETTFFRDVEPFEALKRRVIPALVEARRTRRQLRFWYGASSTGQEPYSVAMLLAEHFPELESWDVTHIGTDLNVEVLGRAREGRYNQVEMNRGLPATYLVKYFDKHGAEWQIKDSIRRRVRFEQMNLVKPWPSAMGSFDVVMMRNVMIYFDVVTKREIVGRLQRLIPSDGYLFLGAAETTLGLGDGFERVQFERAGCYRLAQRADNGQIKGAA